MIILLIILLILLIIILSKIQIKFYLNNKNLKVILIFLYVIKIDLNAKAIKSVKIVKHRTTSTELKFYIKIIFIIVKDSLKKFKYLFSKAILHLNIDCKYYILEPDKTAIIYGIANAVIYNIESIFHLFLKEYISNLNIKPDFENKNNNIKINGNLAIRIVYILVFLIKMVPMIFKYKKLIKSKGGEVNGSSDRRVNENYNG